MTASAGARVAPSGLSGRLRLPSPGRSALGLVCLVAVLFLGLPIAVLLVRAVAGGGLRTAVTDPAVLDALALSFITTLASLAVIVAFGGPLAYALARIPFRGRRMVETLVDLPIVLPPSVAGLALLMTLGRRGALGGTLDALGWSIPFTTLAVVIAQTFVAAPLFIRAARAGFRLVDREQEDAARVDGAGELAVVGRITLPLAMPALAAGAVLAWARALGEFGATILLAGNIAGRTRTLPLFVYSEFQSSIEAAIAAAAVLVVAAFAALIGLRLVDRRSVLDGGAGPSGP